MRVRPDGWPLDHLCSPDAGGGDKPVEPDDSGDDASEAEVVDPDDKEPVDPDTHEGPPPSQDEPVAPGGAIPPRDAGEGV